jgi:peptidyl-tRNA hydrolase, PTH1 family
MFSLIVGLGNPGSEYAGTRHNIGADFVISLADQYDIFLRLDKRFKGLYGKGDIRNQPCHLLIPTTYMNLSGDALQLAQHFFKILPKETLVAHDELDLDLGCARLKYQGGHGGHNGLRDIIAKTSQDFYRLRLGIGHPGQANLVTNYVLSRPSQMDKIDMDRMFENVFEIMPTLMAGQFDQAMQVLHTKRLGDLNGI